MWFLPASELSANGNVVFVVPKNRMLNHYCPACIYVCVRCVRKSIYAFTTCPAFVDDWDAFVFPSKHLPSHEPHSLMSHFFPTIGKESLVSVRVESKRWCTSHNVLSDSLCYAVLYCVHLTFRQTRQTSLSSCRYWTSFDRLLCFSCWFCDHCSLLNHAVNPGAAAHELVHHWCCCCSNSIQCFPTSANIARAANGMSSDQSVGENVKVAVRVRPFISYPREDAHTIEFPVTCDVMLLLLAILCELDLLLPVLNSRNLILLNNHEPCVTCS